MRWIELSAPANSENVGSISSILEKYGQGGAAVEEWQPEDNGETTFLVKVYLPHGHSASSILQEIDRELQQLSFPVHLRKCLLKPVDWFNSLKQHFGILEIGEKFIIKPEWATLPLPSSSRITIELNPGAAFGTGLHPTTKLCLLRIEKHLSPGMNVLDLGTGSGILAIAAAGLGASKVIAFDIDPVASRAALSNVKANGVDRLVHVRRGTLSLRTQRELKGYFDLALANIDANTISDLAGGFLQVLKPGGILIATGFHSSQLDEVLINLALAGFKLTAVDQDGEWNAVTAENFNNA